MVFPAKELVAANTRIIMIIQNFIPILRFQDQFDCIDFSNNEIRRLDNFPFLQRLKMLLINNNKIRYS